MKWYRLKEKPPKPGTVIFIKSKPRIFPKYYIVNAGFFNGHWEFEEAGGERYTYWEENEIEGWTSLSEIEENEEWS